MQDSSEPKNETGNIDWLSIGLVLAGLALLYWISKSNQQVQQGQNVQSQPTSTYENAEEWEIVRGDDGHISNLKVGRNATVGNSLSTSPTNKPISSNYSPKYEYMSMTDSDLENKIREIMKRNQYRQNDYVRLNDNQRKQRFGFN